VVIFLINSTLMNQASSWIESTAVIFSLGFLHSLRRNPKLFCH